MDFVSIASFLSLYYIRPHEWIGIVAALKPVKVVMGVAILSTLYRYRGEIWRQLLKTPHDGWMLAYFLWIVLTAPVPMDTMREVSTHFLIYVVTVLALTGMKRIQWLLNWWMLMMFLLAGLAVASEFGFDPIGSYDRTHGAMQNRLTVNTSLFNGPNQLGHSVYPLVLLLYFGMVWRRPVFVKIAAIPLIALPLVCTYLTLSKGAYLAGFITVIAAMVFGRPKVVQVIILLMAFTVGWSSVMALPRMSELEGGEADQAIQGRIAASRFGLQVMQTHRSGLGYGKFNRSFLEVNKYPKASHSSYVQIGAELGRLGLFIFLGIVYFCLRTIFTAKTRDAPEERIRRMLFVLLFSFLASSWMVDFAFRATFFLLCGVIAAYHRLMFQSGPSPLPEAVAGNPPLASPLAAEELTPALGSAAAVPAVVYQGALDPQPGGRGVIDIEAQKIPEAGIQWNRMRWLDLVMVVLLTYAVVEFWQFIIRRF